MPLTEFEPVSPQVTVPKETVLSTKEGQVPSILTRANWAGYWERMDCQSVAVELDGVPQQKKEENGEVEEEEADRIEGIRLDWEFR